MRKEEYYTRENIAAKAARMAGELPLNPRAAALVPERSALLVVDMQDYFLRPDSHAFLPSAPAIIPIILNLAAAYKKAGRPVIYTRHANRADDAGQMAVWWRELLTTDHPLGSIAAALAAPADAVLEKSQYDAFFHTDFEARLRQSGTRQLAITGVTTHLCCESTARSAFARGFAVFMAIDGTATLNRELHIASLRALAHGCAVPVLASNLLAALAGAE
jgi:bifunctional isochorismate lyase/aryl carrier protein